MRVARAHKDGGVLRWSSSIALALALHVLAIVLLFGNDQAEELSASLPAPILLDLFALPMEPNIASDETMAATADASPAPTAEEAEAVAMAEDPTELPQKCDPHEPGPPAAATVTEWKHLLQLHLDRHKQYPADAQRRGLQGTPHVSFTVCRDGRVLAAHIVRTSGVESLDRAGMDLVRRADPLPRFPESLRGETLDLVLPVEFFLQRPMP